jgi:predicted glycogen debranching enzyme
MIEIGRNVCGDITASTELEWLVTNGTGSYASGTVSGVLTRRYHGLLVAALQPPAGRTCLVTKIDETICYDGQDYPLFGNQWGEADAAITPMGSYTLDSFRLEGTTPVWTYSVVDALLEKRVWMEHGQNTTYVRYTLKRGPRPVQVGAKVLVNYKDFHANTQAGDWHMNIGSVDGGVRVTAFEGATPFYLLSSGAEITPTHDWYRDYFLSREHHRGLDTNGDHLLAGMCDVTLEAGQSVTLVFTTEEAALASTDDALERQQKREATLLEQAAVETEPDWVQHLVLAADQFIVQRRAGDNPDGRSVIAGYHWFGDWGRDTMISLPGLTLATGRHDEAAMVLRTFAEYVDQGMLPNRFPDKGETPEYNTVDATLWYVEAIRAYHAATDDTQLIEDLYPVLQDIIAWHQRGTRYNIHVDPADGLLYSGQNGVQLTWMDAKVGDWVVTPRTGKAVEINALWYNALCSLADFAQMLGRNEDVKTYTALFDQVKASFGRFWNVDVGYCYDVLDTPHGDDNTLRPNQLFAVSLRYSPLSSDQQQAVVDQCANKLYTPHGLRSLAPFDADYIGVYGGDTLQRDGSYHQGTTWGWLIGTFVEAHLRVYQDPSAARSFLMPFRFHLKQQGVGNIAEIFDGDAPHLPRGCVAQAWSVAELLRVWGLTQDK